MIIKDILASTANKAHANLLTDFRARAEEARALASAKKKGHQRIDTALTTLENLDPTDPTYLKKLTQAYRALDEISERIGRPQGIFNRFHPTAKPYLEELKKSQQAVTHFHRYQNADGIFVVSVNQGKNLAEGVQNGKPCFNFQVNLSHGKLEIYGIRQAIGHAKENHQKDFVLLVRETDISADAPLFRRELMRIASNEGINLTIITI